MLALVLLFLTGGGLCQLLGLCFVNYSIAISGSLMATGFFSFIVADVLLVLHMLGDHEGRNDVV